jgi:hypothetical protein
MVLSVGGGVIFTFFRKGDSAMDEKQGEKQNEGSWFLIMVSWEAEADAIAQERFEQVLNDLRIFKCEDLTNPDDVAARDKNLTILTKDDYRSEIVPNSLKALNLIGRRKFVIILQTKSNNVLLALSKMISWAGPVSVEIFPASYVFEVERIFSKK